ncbi:MAG: inorganic pyrophosphatase [Solirubrobacteraceae bacterium]|jgi:inorganic pyrophosphatase|nr:inorganic pyrophosphatase [Solirubrobacteraceae bacterium]
MLAAMADEPLHCLVEIPKGSRNKYQWDADLGGIKLARFLFSSVVYPTDYGFVPETMSPKGEPFDAMILVSEPTFPGCVIPVRAIGVLRTEDERGQDDKLLCVPFKDPGWAGIEALEDVPQRMRNEIEHFFSMYKEPEGRHVTIHGWEDREVAERLLGEARERWRDR